MIVVGDPEECSACRLLSPFQSSLTVWFRAVVTKHLCELLFRCNGPVTSRTFDLF